MSELVPTFASRALQTLKRSLQSDPDSGSTYITSTPSDRCACFMHEWGIPNTVSWEDLDPNSPICEFEYDNLPMERMENGCHATNGRYAIRLQSRAQKDGDLIEPGGLSRMGQIGRKILAKLSSDEVPTQKFNDAKIPGYSTKMGTLRRMRVLTVGTRDDAEARSRAPTFTIGRKLARKDLDKNIKAFDDFTDEVQDSWLRDTLFQKWIRCSIGDISDVPSADDSRWLLSAGRGASTTGAEDSESGPDPTHTAI